MPRLAKVKARTSAQTKAEATRTPRTKATRTPRALPVTSQAGQLGKALEAVLMALEQTPTQSRIVAKGYRWLTENKAAIVADATKRGATALPDLRRKTAAEGA